MERGYITSYVLIDLKEVLQQIAEEQNVSLSKVIEAILQKQTSQNRNGNGEHE